MGLDPTKDFRHTNLSGVVFGDTDVENYDFENAKIDDSITILRLQRGPVKVTGQILWQDGTEEQYLFVPDESWIGEIPIHSSVLKEFGLTDVASNPRVNCEIENRIDGIFINKIDNINELNPDNEHWPIKYLKVGVLTNYQFTSFFMDYVINFLIKKPTSLSLFIVFIITVLSVMIIIL